MLLMDHQYNKEYQRRKINEFKAMSKETYN